MNGRISAFRQTAALRPGGGRVVSRAEWPLASYLKLGALPTAVGCGRDHVRHVLAEWGLDALIDDAVLVTSELLTNALKASQALPAPTPIALRLLANDRQFIIEAWDQRTEGYKLQPPPGDEHGRGLTVGIQQCCQHVIRRCRAVTRLGSGGLQSWAGDIIAILREARQAVGEARARGDTALDPEQLEKLRKRYDEAAAFGITHNRLRDWDSGNHPGYALGCWLRDYKEQVFLFTGNFAVDWTNNVSERGAKAAKRHHCPLSCDTNSAAVLRMDTRQHYAAADGQD